MKYWLFTTEYPPMHGGGISTYCYFTVRMLAAAGHHVTVFVQDESVPDLKIKHETERLRKIHFNPYREKLQGTLGYTAALSYTFACMAKKIIEAEGKPDIIEAQDYLGIAYYLTQFKHAGYDFLSGVPILITLHSPAFIYLEYNRVPLYRFPDFFTCDMEKQAIAAADALISPSHFLVDEIEKHLSLSGKKVAVIANPYASDVSVAAGFSRNKIVYYGKLSPQKGSFELLAYFKQMWDAGFIHPLHIIGGTDIVYHPEQKTMGQLVVQQYGSYIQKGLLQLHGKIAPSKIKSSLADAHVIIVPSVVDNMPYVVMEAMSAGKIVLASKQGGQQEMIEDGVSGYLFDHDEPASFSEQLNKILLLDDAAVQRIGANACQLVQQRYSFEKILSRKISFVNSIKAESGDTDYFPFLHQQPISEVADVLVVAGLLSVVIPYYNMGDYIEACVNSVNQSAYNDIEIIIINDGSTEALAIEKLSLLQKKHTNVTVINRTNHGLAATRNYGAEIAKGEYLAFLDADDMVEPGYYQKAIQALQKNSNVFFVGCWVQYFQNSNAIWPSFTPQPPYALIHNPVNSSSLVYKRNSFLSGGINDKKVDYGLEDYESVISMLHKGFNGIVLPEILFRYRVRTGSMIRNVTREKLLYSNKYITEKHTAYYANFAAPIFNLLNANGPGYLYDNPSFATTVSVRSDIENVFFFKLKTFVKKNAFLKKLALRIKRSN